MMKSTHTATLLLPLFLLAACQKDAPPVSSPPPSPVTPSAVAPAPAVTSADAGVAVVLDGLNELRGKTVSAFPKAASIVAYRDLTDELLKAGAFPSAWVRSGKVENPWTGKIVVQVFPENAWKSGVPSTINFVIESVPKVQCTEMLARLGGKADKSIYKINVEPSGKVFTSFPLSASDACVDGINNIGLTTLAN